MSNEALTTDEVRTNYVDGATTCGCCSYLRDEDVTAFDAWLAEVERAAAEKAWDEGEQAGYEDALGEQRGIRPNESARNPYRREEA